METENHRRFERIPTPPSRACSICRNCMNDFCVERCAPERNFSYFEPDMTIPLFLMPTLTVAEYRALNGRMKGEWLFIQMTKLTEVLYGGELGTPTYSTRSRRILKNLKEQGLLPDKQEENPIPEDGKECKSQGV